MHIQIDYSPATLKIHINKALVNLEKEITLILALTFSPIKDAKGECPGARRMLGHPSERAPLD